MRPQILFPLFAGVNTLPRIGLKTAKAIEKLAGPRLVDLLWHLPSGIVDRRLTPVLRDASPGRLVTLTLQVDAHLPGATPRRPYRVQCSDGTGFIDLVYFHAKPDWLQKLLPVGTRRVVSGRVELFNDQLQMVHPDHVGPPEALSRIATIEPVYPLTAGLAPKILHRAVAAALDRAPDLPEWQDRAWLARRRWIDWRSAVAAAHAPGDESELSPLAPARARLAFDELLANQLALGLVRAAQRRRPGRALAGDGNLRRRVAAALPFTLTAAQEQALAEIAGDMQAPARMLRLLQGDVGSGKTVVAFLAMLQAVEAGTQAAMLAPTEILARQHHDTIAPLAAGAEVPIAALTGRDKGKGRAEILDGLADGRIRLVVGTHALLHGDVAFADLGMAVIDEQHRFGVHQRLELSGKGRAADLLVMTATPIPRTLQLTAYGDMDVSRLTGRPPGRRPVDTRALPLDRLDQVVGAVRRSIAQGAKVYWVCPLLEESESSDLANARARFAALSAACGERVGLIHGRLKPVEKDAIMAAFAGDGLDLLVATTVIEVGVDVPAATVMVIEHAERFGLAQLHQLRGRIGRGTAPSTCLLLYDRPLSETARARIRTLRQSDDGFRIAEADLRLRGAGEMLGTRQSGVPDFRLADLVAHEELLAAARDDARLILEKDPGLTSERGAALRTLLYLFERDAAIHLLRSG